MFEKMKALQPDLYVRGTHRDIMNDIHMFWLDGVLMPARLCMDYLVDTIGFDTEQAGNYLRALIDDAYADPDIYIDDTGAKRRISEDPRYHRKSTS